MSFLADEFRKEKGKEPYNQKEFRDFCIEYQQRRKKSREIGREDYKVEGETSMSGDTTTKEQVILGTIKGMQEIGEYSKELEDYVRRRLDRAYELGYNNGWRNNERIMEREANIK